MDAKNLIANESIDSLIPIFNLTQMQTWGIENLLQYIYYGNRFWHFLHYQVALANDHVSMPAMSCLHSIKQL